MLHDLPKVMQTADGRAKAKPGLSVVWLTGFSDHTHWPCLSDLQWGQSKKQALQRHQARNQSLALSSENGMTFS